MGVLFSSRQSKTTAMCQPVATATLVLVTFTAFYLILPAFVTYASLTLSRQNLLALTPFAAGMSVLWYLQPEAPRGTADVVSRSLTIAHSLASLLGILFIVQAITVIAGLCPDALTQACTDDLAIAWTALVLASIVVLAHLVLLIVHWRQPRVWVAV